MFTTNTNDIKPNSNSNNNNNNNDILKDNDTEEMENVIDRSTAALTALTIQEDTQNNEASNNVSCSNSTDATIGKKKKFYIQSRQIIINTVLY